MIAFLYYSVIHLRLLADISLETRDFLSPSKFDLFEKLVPNAYWGLDTDTDKDTDVYDTDIYYYVFGI